MHISTANKDGVLYICCDGRVKTYEDYLDFADRLDSAIEEHIDSVAEGERKFSKWKIMLLDAYPFNTYALGHLLRLKLHNGYEFALALDNYRLLSLLESVEFHTIFELSIEHDPRSYKA